MDPINYNIQAPDIYGGILKGFQGGIGIQQAQLQQQQQQAALAQQAQQRAVIQNLITNPAASAEDYSRATLLVPGMREQLKQAWDTKNTAQQQTQISDLSQWSAAIQNGKPEYAVDGMNARADALEAKTGAPTPESQALRAQASVVKEHPDFGNFIIKSLLAAHPDGKDVVASIGAQGSETRAQQLQQGLVDKGLADADTARNNQVKTGAEAQVAQNTIPALTAKPALDNRLAEFDRQIAAANSETQRGQLTLERDKYVASQALLNQNAGADQQSHLDTVQQGIDTVNRLLKDPLLDSSIGVGSMFGKLLSFIPGTENKDYRAQVDTLKAQLFLPAVAQLKAAGGAGALSDAEGKKLDASVASLDADQSPKAFKNNLGIVLNLLTKGQQKVLASPKLPTAGGGFVVKHPTFGNVREGDINKLMAQFPGTTRAQVLEYLNSTGAK